jgi:hypothetical protein
MKYRVLKDVHSVTSLKFPAGCMRISCEDVLLKCCWCCRTLWDLKLKLNSLMNTDKLLKFTIHIVFFLCFFLQAFSIGLVVSCCKGRRSYIGDVDSSDDESGDEYDRPIGTWCTQVSLGVIVVSGRPPSCVQWKST